MVGIGNRFVARAILDGDNLGDGSELHVCCTGRVYSAAPVCLLAFRSITSFPQMADGKYLRRFPNTWRSLEGKRDMCSPTSCDNATVVR